MHKTFDDGTLEGLIRKKIQWQISLSENVQLFRGAIDLLDSLHKKVKMALASINNKKVISKLVVEKDTRADNSYNDMCSISSCHVSAHVGSFIYPWFE